jgi:hypothetical protein
MAKTLNLVVEVELAAMEDRFSWTAFKSDYDRLASEARLLRAALAKVADLTDGSKTTPKSMPVMLHDNGSKMGIGPMLRQVFEILRPDRKLGEP